MEDLRDDRVHEVLHATKGVGLDGREARGIVRGEEDNRSKRRAGPGTKEPGSLEASQAWQRGCQHNNSEIVKPEQAQGLLAGPTLHQGLTQRRKDGFEGQEVGLLVIDEKDVDV
jgi:hypothetical protein